MKRKLQFMPKAIHDRRSIHGEANSFKPSLVGKGDHAVVDESTKLYSTNRTNVLDKLKNIL